MNRQQQKILSRNAKAQIKFLTSGRLPRVHVQSSPLIKYLESKSPRERSQMTNVRLHPKLGYNCVSSFPNAQAMLNYLKPPSSVNNDCPAAQRKFASFYHAITDELFNSVQNIKKQLP